MRRNRAIVVILALAAATLSIARQGRGSERAATTAPAATAATDARQPRELALDDGKSAGKMSIAGGGHAVVFDAPAEGSLLAAVKIFGSRYGTQQPPAQNFRVWLSEEDGKPIKEFKFPYKFFARGETRWVKLSVEPTAVPKKFMICVGFDPEATKGVYVHYDKARDGDSRTGLPEVINDRFDKGDWMIRALVVSPSDTGSDSRK
jgi:RNA polymerase sigma-70 factor (ECF subfamily)